jgi:predicted neutral ceramidase superfamily lipid hydrolase
MFLKGKVWFLASLAVFLPIKELMLTIGFLVAADMLVGIWKALKLKQRIRSRRMSDTITKLLLYQIAIMSGFLIESFIIAELIPITKLVATVIAVIEFKSIVESIESVTGKDLWSKLKTIIGRKSEDITDAMTDGKDK